MIKAHHFTQVFWGILSTRLASLKGCRLWMRAAGAEICSLYHGLQCLESVSKSVRWTLV